MRNVDRSRAWRAPALLCAAIVAAMVSANVAAAPTAPREPGDAFRFQLSQTMMQDSNLYRLPDDIDARTLSADTNATRDDVVSRTSASADGGWRFGRQDVEASASVDANRYAHNDSLDNTSGNGRADLNWHLASDWSGQLGGSYGRSLSGFTNSRFLARDVLETDDYHGAMRYEVTPHWNLNGQARAANGSHDTTSRQQDDFDSQTTVFGAGYLSGRGDQFGLEYRRTATSFPNEERGPALFASRRYIDRAANFNLQYAFTVKTSLQGSVGYVWRHYPEGVLGDFAGATWNASLRWEPRSKTRVTLSQWRELNAYLDAESSHFESRGTRLTVAWLPGARETFAFEVSDEHHDYAAFDPASFAQAVSRRDSLRSAQTTFTWQPNERLAIDLACAFERRASNRALYDYDDRLVTAALRLIF